MVKQRLSKVLAQNGVASRRKCETLIFEGKVEVNNKVALLPQTMVDPKKDIIVCCGRPLEFASQMVYYLLNKPKGFVCSSSKDRHDKIVLDLFPTVKQRIFTVGRLDKNTTGLLILTNDGHLANQIIHPRSGIEKEYLVETNKFLQDEDLKALSQGIKIDGKLVKPICVKKVRKNKAKITVMEGKKHEVRLMVKAAGMKVLHLSRLRIGGLSLGKLPLGAYKTVDRTFLSHIFQD